MRPERGSSSTKSPALSVSWKSTLALLVKLQPFIDLANNITRPAKKVTLASVPCTCSDMSKLWTQLLPSALFSHTTFFSWEA